MDAQIGQTYINNKNIQKNTSQSGYSYTVLQIDAATFQTNVTYQFSTVLQRCYTSKVVVDTYHFKIRFEMLAGDMFKQCCFGETHSTTVGTYI